MEKLKNILYNFIELWLDFWDWTGARVRSNVRPSFLQNLASFFIIVEAALSGFAVMYGSVYLNTWCDKILGIIFALNTLSAIAIIKGRTRGAYITALLVLLFASLFLYSLFCGISVPWKAFGSALCSCGYVFISDIIIPGFVDDESKDNKIIFSKYRTLECCLIVFCLTFVVGWVVSEFPRSNKFEATSHLNYIEVVSAELSDPEFMAETKAEKADFIEEKFGERPEKVVIWYNFENSSTYFKMSDGIWYRHHDSSRNATW